MRLALFLGAWAMAASAQGIVKGKLDEIGMDRDGRKIYRCLLVTPTTTRTITVGIQPATQAMEIDLGRDEFQISGFAARSFDPKKRDAHYYLTNGFYPYHYRFTLSLFDDGKKARFMLVEDANQFVCE